MNLSYTNDPHMSKDPLFGPIPKNDDGLIDLDTLTMHYPKMASSYNRLKVVMRWLLFQMHIVCRKINRLEVISEAEINKSVDWTSHSCRDKVWWKVGRELGDKLNSWEKLEEQVEDIKNKVPPKEERN